MLISTWNYATNYIQLNYHFQCIKDLSLLKLESEYPIWVYTGHKYVQFFLQLSMFLEVHIPITMPWNVSDMGIQYFKQNEGPEQHSEKHTRLATAIPTVALAGIIWMDLKQHAKQSEDPNTLYTRIISMQTKIHRGKKCKYLSKRGVKLWRNTI